MGIRILNGGFLTTVQDMGRYGSQETGMAVSGVMDTRAAALADILVGNDENEAVLEGTMMGCYRRRPGRKGGRKSPAPV